MRRALLTDEHVVAFGVVAGARGALANVYKAAVAVHAVVGADTFADDRALRVLA